MQQMTEMGPGTSNLWRSHVSAVKVKDSLVIFWTFSILINLGSKSR